MSSKNLRLFSAVPGAGTARTTAPFSTSPANRPKPEPLKCSDTSVISSGLRRSGLSLPYFSIASRYGMRGYSPAGVTVRPSGELLEHAGQHRLDRVEHVVLSDEAHLEIELVEFARRAVGAGVLVAEAGRDLEIAVEARDHDQLLEHLRRLRKRVELARMDAARDQIVASALRRTGGQDRGLELGEALVDHPAADRSDHRRAKHDVARAPARAEGRGSGT